MLACVLLGVLSSCGVAYISPLVPDNDPRVDIITLSRVEIDRANTSDFTPKSLPAAFFQTAQATSDPGGAIPDPVLKQENRPDALALRLPPTVRDAPYEIGVGDVVLLATPSAGASLEEITGLLVAQSRRQGYTVQDDGAIAIPDVGRVGLAGLTLEEAESEIFQALVSNQIDPSFSIEVSGFNSKRVSIAGGVVRPVAVPITLTPLTVQEALVAAGGVNIVDQDYASIRLYRNGELYQIPLEDYYRQPALQQMRLVAGDSIFVDTEFELTRAQAYFQEKLILSQAVLQAESGADALRRARLDEIRSNFTARLAAGAVPRDYVYMTGEVQKPGRFPLPFEQRASLADALLGESGLTTNTGNPTQIYVLRGQTGSDRIAAYNLDVSNAAKLVLATQMELRPNDIVFVAEQPVTRWNRVLQQIIPSLLTTGVTAATN
ncbi:MAG: polysaccharide biosynthesis/export family protein [Pseudomonadota bacterium]